MTYESKLKNDRFKRLPVTIDKAKHKQFCMLLQAVEGGKYINTWMNQQIDIYIEKTLKDYPQYKIEEKDSN